MYNGNKYGNNILIAPRQMPSAGDQEIHYLGECKEKCHQTVLHLMDNADKTVIKCDRNSPQFCMDTETIIIAETFDLDSLESLPNDMKYDYDTTVKDTMKKCCIEKCEFSCEKEKENTLCDSQIGSHKEAITTKEIGYNNEEDNTDISFKLPIPIIESSHICDNKSLIIETQNHKLNNSKENSDIDFYPSTAGFCQKPRRRDYDDKEIARKRMVEMMIAFKRLERPVVYLPHRKYETLPIYERGTDNDNTMRIFYHRLSFRLPFISNQNIPSADSHKYYDKVGCLQKLCGRGFPYLHQWKRRYCVLSKGCLFIYDNENSKSNDKNSCVIDLKYFDQVTQALQKESKKAANVFIVTSQDKTFFDQGRHLFSADTLTDMHEWISRLKASLDQIRNNNRSSSCSSKKDRRESKETSSHSQRTSISDNNHSIDDTSDVHDGAARILKEEVQRNCSEIKTLQRLSREIISEVPTIQDPEEGNNEVVAKKKISSHKTYMRASEQAEVKPLESITKHRVKGPPGRRAPQTRKTVEMNQRTSSLSALQHDNSVEDCSRMHCLNLSDLVEDNFSDMCEVHSSNSALAYHYSSDEESTPSNMVREIGPAVGWVPNAPLKIQSRRGSPPLPECHRNENLLEYRSLPKSLRKKKDLTQVKGDTLLMKLPTFETSSSSVLSSLGRASPEMDELDNLLMSQSVCQSSPCHKMTSENEGSDGSTCKRPEDVNHANKISEEYLKALENCAGSIQQLQHHSTDLELRTNRIESEISLTTNDISSILETSSSLKNNVEKLAKAVSIISEEASTTHRDFTLQRKENERIQKATVAALKEAKQAYLECEHAKCNYESLIKELHSLIISIRASLILTEEEVPERKQNSEPKNRETTDSKKTAKLPNRTTGYQSFFQRPTSLIYTLTNRSANKSTSSIIDTKLKERESKKEKAVIKNKQSDILERKINKEKNSQNSTERRSRSSNRVDGSQPMKAVSDSMKESIKASRETSRSRDKTSKLISGLSENISFEDIPMMDDFSDSRDHRKKAKVAVGISHVTINVSPPLNRLEKSFSSPVMSSDKKQRRPNFLNIVPDINGSTSNHSSPESPINNFIPYENVYGSCKEFIYQSDRSPLIAKHKNSLRQSAMSTLPEECNVSLRNRQGTFAISRQSSTPNIPLQRQNSATLLPLQRQHSLGTVPEEGTLPRQASLMSVPEERPIVDRTLPLSPSPSLIAFPLSRNSSAVDAFRSSTTRNSMELLTGPIIAGSQIQESFIRSLPPSLEFGDSSNSPIATSSFRRPNDNKRNSKIVHV